MTAVVVARVKHKKLEQCERVENINSERVEREIDVNFTLYHQHTTGVVAFFDSFFLVLARHALNVMSTSSHNKIKISKCL